jgi:uncharacterized protein (TIGR02246 family)
MEERNRVRRLIADLVDAYNAKDLERVMSWYHPDASYWSALGDWRRGAAEVRAHIEELFEMLPDEHMTTRVLIADGTTAVAEFTGQGTAPSGTAYSLDFTEVFTIRDGKIAEVRVYLDPEEVEAALG